MLPLPMSLQAQIVDIRSAQDTISNVRQVTAITPAKLTSSDVQNVAAVLDRVAAVLRRSPSDGLTTKVGCNFKYVSILPRYTSRTPI